MHPFTTALTAQGYFTVGNIKILFPKFCISLYFLHTGCGYEIQKISENGCGFENLPDIAWNRFVYVCYFFSDKAHVVQFLSINLY